MSSPIRQDFAARAGAHLCHGSRRIATGFVFFGALLAASCNTASVLTPVPAVDIGTHTAAIASPSPSLGSPGDAAELPVARSESGSNMVWQTGPAGIVDSDEQVGVASPASQPVDAEPAATQPLDTETADAQPAGGEPEDSSAALSEPEPVEQPSAQPSYGASIPVSATELPEPAIEPAPRSLRRRAAEPPTRRYAMLPPAAPGNLAAPRIVSPAPEPEQTPEYSPPRAAPEYSGPPAVMPADEVARRRELKRLGVRYEDLPPIYARGGACRIDYPIKVMGLSGGIELKPAATLNTNLAVTFAKYMRADFAPAVRWRYLSSIKTIYTGSTYSCRNMIGESSHHISEHAKGNAIDVMKIKLDSGRMVDVTKPGFFSFRQRGFLNRVRAEACGYFTTVLGPGYNRAHANHFHFDLMHRRNGYVACR